MARMTPPDGGVLACAEPTFAAHLRLSHELWTVLVEQLNLGDAAEPNEIPIAISARYSIAGNVLRRRSLVAFAGHAERSRTKDQHKHTLFVPSLLYAAHPTVFGQARPVGELSQPSLLISLAKPLPFSNLILVAADAASYAYACNNRAELEASLAKRGTVLREGEAVSVTQDDASAETMSWKVAMAEPVLQGVVQAGVTRFLVVPGGDGAVESTAPSVSGDSTFDEDDGDSDSGASSYTIDDSFLAPSILSSPPKSVTSPPPPHQNSLAVTNGASHSPFPSLIGDANAHPSQGGVPVDPIPLQQFIPSSLLIPRPREDEDDLPRLYVRTTDLGRLGSFSGDWVMVRTENDEMRLARVFAAEQVLSEVLLDTCGSLKAFLPPPFLHNLSSTSASSTSPCHVSVSPIGISSPVFPTARSVTIARVASPHSVNRAYQSLFLIALKEHFQSRRRVLKKGDLIAVGIREELARFSEGRPEEEEVELPACADAPTAIVFFQITALEAPSRARASRREDAVTEQIEAGEFGFFVDPAVTKLMQVGVERSLVPDAAAFLGIPESPLLSTTAPALGGTTPSLRLFEYATSLLRAGVSDYNLDLTVLVKGAEGSGKRTVVRSVARQTGFHILELDCFDLIGETELKTEAHLRAAIDKAVNCSPSMLLLRNIEALARKSQALETGQEPAMSTILRECFSIARESWKATGFPVVVLATTCDVDKIPTGVLGAFKEEINLEAPGESERLGILSSLTTSDVVAPDVSLRALAVQTAALVANDLVDLVTRARSSAIERALTVAGDGASLDDVGVAGVALTSHDFNGALEKARSAYSESIGAPKIPTVAWDDVGGLVSVKSDILDTIQLPLEHPELFADGLKKRSGILLYGPPGTGKTLLAKAVATSCSLNFFSVKGPELLNMYIGESEANVRRVFQRARDAKPCVIFFDELDSVAPKRGNQGDSGGVMDRIVSQLLAELDGMAEGKGGTDVFVIGATNRPDLLDPALLRPGRFDRMLYLGVSDNHDSQLKIIQALTRKFKLHPSIALEQVAELCPFNYTGADFYALCSDAMLKAMTRKAEEIDRRIADLNSQPPYKDGPPLTPQYYLAEMATPAEVEVLVSQADFEAALAELVPSVSQAEMLHYKQVQQQFSAPTAAKKELDVPKRDKGKGKQKQAEVEPLTNGFANGYK